MQVVVVYVFTKISTVGGGGGMAKAGPAHSVKPDLDSTLKCYIFFSVPSH
jgi:hypothetical protein